MGEIRIFDFLIVDGAGLLLLVIRFFLDLVCITVLIQKIYLRVNKNHDYLMIFYSFNILVFFLSSLLTYVRLEAGFAFGLFALFSIIRYRTRQIPIKEMTFLFTSIIVAVINSTVTNKLSYAEVFFADIAILVVCYIMERSWLKFYRESKTVTYEKIELILPEKRKELIADLEKRTGLKITGVKVLTINFLRDTAKIQVYFRE